ncbi:MAG: putative sugar O-methyltransferase [Elusimicrobia bacterium]|nr:putative sugar O-methyltransferase [Elusimicrobiota bacterium]
MGPGVAPVGRVWVPDGPRSDQLGHLEILRGAPRVGPIGRASGLAAAPGVRRTVCEIGGWGGFAYQFKSIFPFSTYVIVDFPELFLFSAVYLRTVFPRARMWIYGETPLAILADQWDSFDFIFLPNFAFGDISFPRIDLTLNMVSFQEMTATQVEFYVSAVEAAGCPTLYSLNMWKPKYNPQLNDLIAIMRRHYDLRKISVLERAHNDFFVPRTSPSGPWLSRVRQALRQMASFSFGRRSDLYSSGYAHLIGRVTARASVERAR